MKELNMKIEFTNTTADIMSQCIQAKKSSFSKYERDFDVIFRGKEKVKLDRQAVFDFFEEDLNVGILAAFVWGFPTGGRGQLISSVVKNRNHIADVLDRAKNRGLDRELFEEINSPKYLNYATTTKFLYFSRTRVGELSTLIFDQRVKLYLQSNKIEQYSPMQIWLNKKYSYSLPFEQYVNYLKGTKNLQIQHKLADPAIIEHYFFENAPMKRKPRHLICD